MDSKLVPMPPASQDDKLLGIVMHALCLVGFPLIGPLVIWLIKKNQSAYLDQQGRELLNFQLTFLIYLFAAFLLTFVFIGVILMPIIGFATIILTIIGIVHAAEGKVYRFPLTIRML